MKRLNQAQIGGLIIVGVFALCLLILGTSQHGKKPPAEKWKLNPAYAADGTIQPTTRELNQPPRPPKEVIDAVILRDTLNLAIVNGNRFDWGQTTVYIGGVFNGYRYTVRGVKAGKSVKIPLFEFTKRNGERFKPLERAPTDIIVSVDGYDAPQFTFRN
jgi:hypothetical protein